MKLGQMKILMDAGWSFSMGIVCTATKGSIVLKDHSINRVVIQATLQELAIRGASRVSA